MVRKAWVLVLIVAIAMPLIAAKKASTAPGTYEAWGPDIDRIEIVRSFKAADYPDVMVQTLDVSATPPPEDADLAAKTARVLKDATKPFFEALAKERERVYMADANEPGKRTLIVRGRVITMDPGSRSKRIFIGYGAGAARTAISGEIVDASSGEVLLRFTQERRSGMERFGRGSSYEEIMERNLAAIGKDVARILEQF